MHCGARAIAPSATLMLLLLGTLILSFPLSVRADEFERLNNEGSNLLEQERLEEALRRFEQAEIEQPGSPVTRYNIGNVMYRGDRYDTAAIFYQDAIRRDEQDDLRGESAYNLGNALFRQGNLQAAIEAYKLALIENPDDNEAKFNLEYALRQAQPDSSQKDPQDCENEQPDSTQQDQNQPDSNRQQESDSTKQQQDQQQQQQQQPDSTQQQQEQEQQQQDEQPSEEEQQQQAQSQPKPEGMTDEDVQRLLEALKNQERELMKQRRRQAAKAEVEKDW